ncbi:MAG: hypothetical protein CVU73_10190 [Deltaproteobacteria bacterium HGW-Deltaproteobacteria-8]|jgi:hypothetical protein|nr:MAG: hypothetical protein CVU73_10190 [Deltaproteobacteria bacterium HGW-Deltaproteobacteria-8]
MDTGHFPSGLRERAKNIAQKLRLRRRMPWNWCLQTASLGILPFGLVLHSPALLALAAIGLAAGCLDLPLPPMEHTDMKRFLPGLERLIGLECAWLAGPLDRRKKRQLVFLGLGAPIAAWFLWQQDFAPVGLVVMAAYLLHIRRKNREDGIEP